MKTEKEHRLSTDALEEVAAALRAIDVLEREARRCVHAMKDDQKGREAAGQVARKYPPRLPGVELIEDYHERMAQSAVAAYLDATLRLPQCPECGGAT